MAGSSNLPDSNIVDTRKASHRLHNKNSQQDTTRGSSTSGCKKKLGSWTSNVVVDQNVFEWEDTITRLRRVSWRVSHSPLFTTGGPDLDTQRFAEDVRHEFFSADMIWGKTSKAEAQEEAHLCSCLHLISIVRPPSLSPRGYHPFHWP